MVRFSFLISKVFNSAKWLFSFYPSTQYIWRVWIPPSLPLHLSLSLSSVLLALIQPACLQLPHGTTPYRHVSEAAAGGVIEQGDSEETRVLLEVTGGLSVPLSPTMRPFQISCIKRQIWPHGFWITAWETGFHWPSWGFWWIKHCWWGSDFFPLPLQSSEQYCERNTANLHTSSNYFHLSHLNRAS